jgi:hypothetical protein
MGMKRQAQMTAISEDWQELEARIVSDGTKSIDGLMRALDTMGLVGKVFADGQVRWRKTSGWAKLTRGSVIH